MMADINYSAEGKRIDHHVAPRFGTLILQGIKQGFKAP